MALITIYIENRPYQVEAGLTVLEAARRCGYEIPSLCDFNRGKCSLASCRVCLVKVIGVRGLVASCVYPVSDGLQILINSRRAVETRRTNVELLLSNHNKNCPECRKQDHCELLHVARIVGAREHQFDGEMTKSTYDDLSNGLIRDTSKCILCGRCIEVCKDSHGIGILGFENRGFNTIVGPAYNKSFKDVGCLQCGQCVNVCPTGALMEKGEIGLIDEARRQNKYIIVQTAPAVRVALGEEFGYPVGTNVTGKMVAALRRLGFYRVYDTNFGADLTIMEESSELIDRIQNSKTLPMITSCSPGWVNYMEQYYPNLIDHLSTCKSPHEMEGAIIKSYFAQKNNIDPKDIFVVSVMPCTAKKDEKERIQNRAVDNLKDVDCVLTTRELATLIKREGIQFHKLPEEKFDQDLLGEYSGAGVIFGVTGGVMEAACRTAHYLLTGKNNDALLEFYPVRGFQGVKETTIEVAGNKLNIAVASGMLNAKRLLDDIANGNSKYHFIEIMCCPGGCINGGGQPYVRHVFKPNEDDDIQLTYRKKRADALYNVDVAHVLRYSHENSQINELYDNYLHKPGSKLAHHLLHTSYSKRDHHIK